MALTTDGHQDRPIRIQINSAAEITAVNLIETRVTGDLFPRFILRADGTILKGNGASAPV